MDKPWSKSDVHMFTFNIERATIGGWVGRFRTTNHQIFGSDCKSKVSKWINLIADDGMHIFRPRIMS